MRYIKAARPILKKKIRAIRTLQQSNPLYDPLQIRPKLGPQYHDISNLPVFLKDDFDAAKWVPAKTPPMYTNTLKHPSRYGLMTRSKAEAMIATVLKESELKFQYEPEVRHKKEMLLIAHISTSQKKRCAMHLFTTLFITLSPSVLHLQNPVRGSPTPV